MIGSHPGRRRSLEAELAAALKGDGEVAVGMRDLALEAAFTSMSLRERWRAPGVEDTLELITLSEEMLHRQELQTWQNGMFLYMF